MLAPQDRAEELVLELLVQRSIQGLLHRLPVVQLAC
jgi:hypothetical protein